MGFAPIAAWYFTWSASGSYLAEAEAVIGGHVYVHAVAVAGRTGQLQP